ncbi:MAG TPA: DUF2500 domain-containing protein [Candidatus Faecousia intestinigallinarum]|nr:DUF2500 domain-containing protein [Candidatus Faecousia intestinigallinarum]
MDFYGGFNNEFNLFSIMFFIVFFLILAVIVATLIRGLFQWNKNNHAPKLTVDATVVTKRMQVSRHHHTNEMHSHSTTYFATFQVESGDRIELSVRGDEYGLLVEGDRGKLTFQGTRYLGFERK